MTDATGTEIAAKVRHYHARSVATRRCSPTHCPFGVPAWRHRSASRGRSPLTAENTVLEDGREWTVSLPASPVDRYVRWTHEVTATLTLVVSGTIGSPQIAWRLWDKKRRRGDFGYFRAAKVSRETPECNLRLAHAAALPSIEKLIKRRVDS